MEFLRKLKNVPLIVLITCLGLIGCCLYKVVFVPISMELDSIRAETVAVNRQIVAVPMKIHDLSRLRDDYAQAVSALESINSQVTSETALPYFIKELEDISKEAGTRISSVSVGTLTAGSFYSKIPMTVTLRGSYGEVRRFIQGLAKLGRAFKISDLGLESPGSSENSSFTEEHVLNATVSLVVYVVPKGGDT